MMFEINKMGPKASITTPTEYSAITAPLGGGLPLLLLEEDDDPDGELVLQSGNSKVNDEGRQISRSHTMRIQGTRRHQQNYRLPEHRRMR